jgi:superfamily II DNA/RNA helicase
LRQHVDNLDLVVNVDPPNDHKDYLHRGGRTARAGESGLVVTLVTPDQRRDVVRLMSDAGIRPRTTPVRSGEAELSRITGAQTPSGVPVVITAPVVERPKRSAPASRGRRSRTAKDRRTGQAARRSARGQSAFDAAA